MTAHIINAAVFIRVMRGRKAAMQTLISRDIDFDTAYRASWPALIYVDGASADGVSVDR
jgi:hypothetical protein